MSDPRPPHDLDPLDPELDRLVALARAGEPSDADWGASRDRLQARLAAARGAPAGIVTRWRRQRPAVRLVKAALAVAAMLAAILVPLALMNQSTPALAGPLSTPGEFILLNRDGSPIYCSLEHTAVEADIAGLLAHVTVRQSFRNPSAVPADAVYRFPLPHGAAIDRMVIKIGARVIEGVVHEKEQARQEYQQARAQGRRAALLEEQRPNIFQQSVANIQPGERIEIEIGFHRTLDWVDGESEFAFPLVVAPRYEDGATTAAALAASEPIVSRPGGDVSIAVNLASTMPFNSIVSPSHEIVEKRPGKNTALVTLKNRREIPNRDFILRFSTAGDRIGDAFFVRDDPRGKFFSLILEPPRRVLPADLMPRELVFVIDRSGSMEGWKLAKAVAAMRRCIEHLNPGDTFDLVSFSNGAESLFNGPVPIDDQSRALALQYLDTLAANGGTQMFQAIESVLARPVDPRRAKIVCFMSDGQVGNDFEILELVRKNAATVRFFTFGVGDSVNRYLLESVARVGRGDVQWVTESDDIDAVADAFYLRVNAPVLTDISLAWSGVEGIELAPATIPDLLDRRPLMLTGKLTGAPSGSLTITGRTAAGPWRRTIRIPEDMAQIDNPALPVTWARARVDQFMLADPSAMTNNPDAASTATRAAILDLGLHFQIVTQFTSFIAVERERSPRGGEAVRVPDTPTDIDPPGEVERLSRLGFETRRGRAYGYYSRSAEAEARGVQPEGRGDQPVALTTAIYDPSNGTASNGDLWRVEDLSGTNDSAVWFGRQAERAAVTESSAAIIATESRVTPPLTSPDASLDEKELGDLQQVGQVTNGGSTPGTAGDRLLFDSSGTSTNFGGVDAGSIAWNFGLSEPAPATSATIAAGEGDPHMAFGDQESMSNILVPLASTDDRASQALLPKADLAEVAIVDPPSDDRYTTAIVLTSASESVNSVRLGLAHPHFYIHSIRGDSAAWLGTTGTLILIDADATSQGLHPLLLRVLESPSLVTSGDVPYNQFAFRNGYILVAARIPVFKLEMTLSPEFRRPFAIFVSSPLSSIVSNRQTWVLLPLPLETLRAYDIDPTTLPFARIRPVLFTPAGP